jgi:sugar phosphate isomerase/epimerase
LLAWPLGVVDIVYTPAPAPDAARFARADGFEHIDVLLGVDEPLALPIGCPTAFPKPRPGWCATPAPPEAPGAWERAVEWWRKAPGALLEPWAGACVHSLDTVLAFRAAVPGVRLLVDTGHVADWGGDPCELLAYADHIQLRQGRPGATQVHVDDPDGIVDFDAVLARLETLGYMGRLSIEYFDLPEHGWPLADPRGWAVDLARKLRGG